MKRHIIFAALTTLASVAYAEDGVILIDDAKALVGSVTPQDAAGYPITITKPGKYKLIGSLKVPTANTIGIEIYANGVDIDLNGHSIVGPNTCNSQGLTPVTGCTANGTGSGVKSWYPNTTVHDGTVRGMGLHGLELRYNSGAENVNALNNGSAGINVYNGTIKNCRSMQNGGWGLYAGYGTVVSGNTSTLNGGDGLYAGQSSIVVQNALTANAGYGINGGYQGVVNYNQNTMFDNKKGNASSATDTGGNL